MLPAVFFQVILKRMGWGEKLPSDESDQPTLDFGEDPAKVEEKDVVAETPIKAHNRKKSGRKPEDFYFCHRNNNQK